MRRASNITLIRLPFDFVFRRAVLLGPLLDSRLHLLPLVTASDLVHRICDDDIDDVLSDRLRHAPTQLSLA